MTQVTEKIKQHGYWRVLIRPERYVGRRIENITSLFPLVQRCAVQLRGWDFPHIDILSRPDVGDDWVGQDCEWGLHLERWRAFQSGQFAYLGAFALDLVSDTKSWLMQPPIAPQGKLIGASDVVCRFAEFFEFASAYALSPAGDDAMFVRIGCHGIKDREIWLDDPNRMPFLRSHRTAAQEFVQEAVISREVLGAEARMLANRWAKELFRRFNWDVGDDTVESLRRAFR